jgi:hypothetical protein
VIRQDGRWALSAKTTCALCGKPIGKSSYSCPGPGFDPVHMTCRWAEMAVTNGEEAAQ